MLLRRALSGLHLRFQRRFVAETSGYVLATSLRDIARSGVRVVELQLRNSNDLVCHQLLCEFVGNACACRLSLALERVPRLQHLDLSHNQLRALPDAVYALQNLKTLNVQENQLTTLSTDVEKLIELETLDVGYNELKTLPVEQLETLTRLKTLRVVGNFDLITKLETLKMSKQLKDKVVME
ncbi:unnamed protein product [Peronospora destructor]|uniref:Uncharacterized protein n=1 Tax=Peronospora destructor TaxID=86335 RepID=A0AAV0UHL9_9STRA|nr:unnamed protein product [Peronospora destructor]